MIPGMSGDAPAEREPQEKDRGGKPLTIDEQTLLSNRDGWIALLSNAWGDIGWLLKCAHTSDHVRASFTAVKDATPREQFLLKPFLGETSLRVTAPEMRRTRRAVSAVRDREYNHTYRGNTFQSQFLAERLRDAEQALKLAATARDEDRERIQEEHGRRVAEVATFNRELAEMRKERAALETTLDEHIGDHLSGHHEFESSP